MWPEFISCYISWVRASTDLIRYPSKASNGKQWRGCWSKISCCACLNIVLQVQVHMYNPNGASPPTFVRHGTISYTNIRLAPSEWARGTWGTPPRCPGRWRTPAAALVHAAAVQEASGGGRVETDQAQTFVAGMLHGRYFLCRWHFMCRRFGCPPGRR